MKELNVIREQLKDRRLDIVAKATGLHPMTVARVRDGRGGNPQYETLKALSDYLEAQDAKVKA